MDQALTARAASGQPVRLLAHSMGGVVARTVQLERPAVWQRWLERPGSRLLMLGTPNGGSFAPMQVLSGDDTMGNALAAFGLPFQDHKARRLMAAMPGFMQLQAGLLDPTLGLAQSERWQALAEQDMKTLEEANVWHDPSSQRTIYRWGVPPQEVLDRAVALRRRLDQQRDTALPGFSDRLLMVVGHARFTPAGFEMDAREGPGLPGPARWRRWPRHAGQRLAARRAHLAGGLRTRRPARCGFGLCRPTLNCCSTATRNACRWWAQTARGTQRQHPPPRLVRSRPSRQRSAVVQPPTGLGELLAPVADAAHPHRSTRRARCASACTTPTSSSSARRCWWVTTLRPP